MLIGGGFGAQPDWSKITSSKSVGALQLDNNDSSQQVSDVVAGGFAAALLPKKPPSQSPTPVASVLSVEHYRAMQPQFLTGSFCTEDGREVIVPQFAEGEPPADGSGGENGEDDEPFIPQVDVPDLQSATGSPNSFVPPDTTGSSTSMTLHGSFTASSLTNPDLDADGINWVHVVTTNWIDESTWSYTESLVLSYNLSASDSSSSEDEEQGDDDGETGSGDSSDGSESGSGGSEEGDDSDDAMQVTSN